MQEPDNFHFYCFEKDAVEVFNRASVNKVLPKYTKSINRVSGSTCAKICINFTAIYRFIWFLHETRSSFYDAQFQKYLGLIVIVPEMVININNKILIQNLLKFGTLCVLSPFGGLGAMYTVHLKFVGKVVVDFLFVLTGPFSPGVMAEALRANIDCKLAFLYIHSVPKTVHRLIFQITLSKINRF